MADMKPVNRDADKDVPQVNAPSNNRMIIAFPFSAVRVSHSDEAVSELAALVAELAELVAQGAPNPRADEIAVRARGLARQIARDVDD